MSAEFKYIEDVEPFCNESILPEFPWLNSRPNFSMLRLQSVGKLVADTHMGPVNKVETEEVHLEKCRNALKVAREELVDLLVFPEYSTPPSLIKEILDSRDLQPPIGKLWCLPLQAIKTLDFEGIMEKWEDSGARVVRNAFDEIQDIRKFIDVLVYVFRLRGREQLCIVPQLKTITSVDNEIECEQAELAEGKTIFVFGKNCTNRLITLICSDSLNINVNPTSFFQDSNGLIVIHPQLNFKPRHENFAFHKKGIYLTSRLGDRTLYLTSNWAHDTVVQAGGMDYYVKNPWSCIYFRQNAVDQTHDFLKIVRENFHAGLGYLHWKNVRAGIWFANKSETLQYFYLAAPLQSGNAVFRPEQVVAQKSWVWSDNVWKLSYDREDLGIRFRHFENDLGNHIPNTPNYQYPHKQEDIVNLDAFFGLCMGHLLVGELESSGDEISRRISIHIDDQCSIGRSEQIEIYKKLVLALQNHGLPDHIGTVSDQHFDLDENFLFNLLVTKDSEQKRFLTAFAPLETKAEQIAKNLSNVTSWDKVVVFANDTNGNYTTYPKYDPSFKNPYPYKEPKIK